MKNKRVYVFVLFMILIAFTLSAFAVSPIIQNYFSNLTEEEFEDEGPDVPITGDALDTASEVALNFIGEGRVTETEVGDEEGYYEVEITLDNGNQVDVHLDEEFNVLGVEWEDEFEDDD